MKEETLKNIIGKQNGVLVCIGLEYETYDKEKRRKRSYVRVKCLRCGHEDVVRAETFSNKAHNYKACKYCRHEIYSEVHKKYPFEKEDRTRIYSIHSSAKQRNLIVKLSAEEIVDILHKPCVYCGVEHSNGIDRIDSSKGYIQGNVVPCCSICNWMKNSLPVEEFYNHIDKIYNFIHGEGSTTIPRGSTSQANGDGKGGILTA